MVEFVLPTNLADWPVVTEDTPATLSAAWKKQREPTDVLAFYHDWKGAPWREFSIGTIKEGSTFVCLNNCSIWPVWTRNNERLSLHLSCTAKQ